MLLEGDIFTKIVKTIDPKLARSTNELARVRLRLAGEVHFLGAGDTISLQMKPWGKYDANVAAGVTLESGDLHPESGEYRKSFTTSTPGVLGALFVNSSSADDKLEATFSTTLVHVASAILTVLYPVQTIIFNSDYSGAVTTPGTVSPFINPGYWTSINDGSDTALNSIPTDDGAWPLGNVVYTAINGVYQVWQLQSNTGSAVSDGVNFQRPADYHATLNDVIWVKIS